MDDIKKIIELGKFIKQSMFDGSYKQNPAFDEGVLLFTSNALALLKEQDNEIDTLKTLLLGYETGAIKSNN